MTNIQTSYFINNSIDQLYEEVQQTYLNYPYPWIVGYSGGKDSTTTLQVIWNALEKLPKKDLTKPIYVISTDTLVETPVIVDHVDDNIEKMNAAAKKKGLPLKAYKLTPETEDTFWVNLLGRGYPAPTSIFRWCTDRLKIKPSNKFIMDKIGESGEVILALGSRQGESMTRDQVIQLRNFKGNNLSYHSQINGAWVYMPIEHFTTDDVWSYLIQVKSPWGGDNRSLASLYRSAQSDECPLVVDTTTPSCGNSRFGCWTCTVVNRDKSMEAMIDSGEEWMIPLLDFRDWLASTQDPSVKPLQREYRSRDGRIKITEKGVLRYRTYTLEFSKEMMRRLLRTQEEIQETNPEFELINAKELKAIRRIWIMERQDWADELPNIVKDESKTRVRWPSVDLPRPSQLDAEILAPLAQKYDLPIEYIQKLLDAEWQHFGMRRRSSIHKTIEKIHNQDWRSLDEVQVEMKRRHEKSNGILKK